jgi:hypothetical protein
MEPLTVTERTILSEASAAVVNASPTESELPLVACLNHAVTHGAFRTIEEVKTSLTAARGALGRIALESDPNGWVVDITGMSDGMEIVSSLVIERAGQYRKLHDALTVLEKQTVT